MADTIPTQFTVPLVEYTRLAAQRDALAARLAEAERLLRYSWIAMIGDHYDLRASIDRFLVNTDKPAAALDLETPSTKTLADDLPGSY